MKKRILSAIFTLLFVASLPVTAFAGTYDLTNGSVEVSATESGQSVRQGTTSVADDPAPVITSNGAETQNTVTIKADAGQTANVTLKDVNIDVSGKGTAAVSTGGDGDVTIELEGTNTVTSGTYHAGVEKNNDGSLTITDADNNGSLTATGGWGGAGIGGGNKSNGSNITITGGTVNANGGDWGAGIGGGAQGNGSNITITGGEVTANGGRAGGAGIGGGNNGGGSNITVSGGKVNASSDDGGAGIGGGYRDNGSDITISGSDITISGGEVTATGGYFAAGIGGGQHGSGSNITVSGDAQVKVQGGKQNHDGSGTGAGIGNGGTYNDENTPLDGAEVDPDVSKLTTKGKIEYYAPGVNMNDSTAKPTKTTIGKYVPPVAAKAAEQTVKLYSVVDKDGRGISYKSEVKDGVLTITVDGDYAAFTGAVSGISVLTAQGIKTVVFVTSGATSAFALADLSARGSGTYKLTHNGAAVTFTLGTTDISEILK